MEQEAVERRKLRLKTNQLNLMEFEKEDATKWFCMESLTYAEKIMVAAIMVAESISVRSIFFTKAFVGNATCLDFDTYIN